MEVQMKQRKTKSHVERMFEKIKSNQRANLTVARPSETRKISRSLGGGAVVRRKIKDKSPVGGLFAAIGQ
jgi:hypothetical protein